MPSDKFSKLTWHKRTHGHEFTGAEFRVLMSIFDHSDEHGRNSHPGLKLLMDETGYGKTAVSVALTALQARGWITQTRKGSGTSGMTSVYELVPGAPSGFAGANQPPEVGSLERTSGFAGANQLGSVERTPTDPDIRSGSDPSRSDQGEVRSTPNHLEGQDETGHGGRSLAVEDQTAAPGGANGLGQVGPSLVEPATADLSPEERLLVEIRAEGSVGAKSELHTLMGVSNREVNAIVPRMIADGLIIHDTDREHPALILA